MVADICDKVFQYKKIKVNLKILLLLSKITYFLKISLGILTFVFLLTYQVKADNDPTSEPLLKLSNLVYEGSFRLPKGHLGDNTTKYDTLAYSHGPIAFNPLRNSLLIIGHPYGNRIVEISIPEIVKSNKLGDLKTARVIQPPIDITEGHWSNLALDGSVPPGTHGVPGGLLVFHNRLIGSAYIYYDAACQGYRSHFYASPNWEKEGTNFHGMYHIGPSDWVNGGLVGGYMTIIPPEWRKLLGGPVLTGLGGITTVFRSSFGPCAWVFNSDDLGKIDPAPAEMLVGYPAGHTTLGTYGGTSLYYNMATEIRGLVFPYGTRSVLFFGRHGLGMTGKGDGCYGEGTSDPSLHKKEVPGSNGRVKYCYDPVAHAKGGHAYPYVARIWAYDANDLLKVKNGEINPQTGRPYKPWDIKPYAIWNLDLPFMAPDNGVILGAAYDPSTQRIFLLAPGEKPGYDPYPLIYVFRVKLSSISSSTR